jgi:valyl-tRNA synthetase
MKAEVSAARVSGDAATLALVEQAAADLRAAGSIEALTFEPGTGDITVDVTLAG